ncbi:MAG: hypothetical protein JWN40_3454 [Phycisphaerales bacterium]|nr:hypothetical protein [Phycisphaerales bacterium]
MRNAKQRARRGVTSVLAMLYLVLFSCLAVGFYAAVTTAVQVSANETHGRRAMLSAESGMEFMRYIMGNVDIPHSTPPDQMWTQLCTQVKQQLDGTANIGGATITMPTGEIMNIPTITLDSSGSTLTASLIHSGQQVIVKVSGTGPDAGVSRTVQISYAQAQRASAIFDYGVASKSAISMGGNAKITGVAGALARGSVLSATTGPNPLKMTGGPSISGDFSYTNTSGTNTYGSGSIAGYTSSNSNFADHIHAGVVAPEFPTIDTSVFAPFVPSATAPAGPQVITSSNPAGTSFTNIRIKAGANPKFNANTVIRGVVYVETPNQITFNGGATIQGVIVVQNNPTGSTTTNTMKFSGNITHQGVETLDPAVFGNLTKLTGSFLLAPSFAVTMTGNSNQVGGTIVTSKLDVSGSAGATVKGTVINLEDTGVNLTGTADIIIASTGTTNYPAGVVFGTHFAPLPDTYQEAQ